MSDSTADTILEKILKNQTVHSDEFSDIQYDNMQFLSKLSLVDEWSDLEKKIQYQMVRNLYNEILSLITLNKAGINWNSYSDADTVINTRTNELLNICFRSLSDALLRIKMVDGAIRRYHEMLLYTFFNQSTANLDKNVPFSLLYLERINRMDGLNPEKIGV